MTTEVISQALVANQQATFGQGRVWYIKAATAALSITAERLGTGASIRRFINVGAGFKFTAREGDGWTYLRVASAVNQNIEIIIGDDDVEVANAVSVTGSVTVQDVAANAVADTAPVVQGTGAAGALFAANPLRRRITVYADSNNPGSCFARTGAGTNNIAELQPGVPQEFRGTYGMFVRNDTGANCTFYLFEES